MLQGREKVGRQRGGLLRGLLALGPSDQRHHVALRVSHGLQASQRHVGQQGALVGSAAGGVAQELDHALDAGELLNGTALSSEVRRTT